MAEQLKPAASSQRPSQPPTSSKQPDDHYAAIHVLQEAALSAQGASAAEQTATADLGSQALLVAAYCRRLERLASLLQQYDSHLQRTLASLGLTVPQDEGSGTAPELEPIGLTAMLQEVEAQLTALLLEQGSGKGPASAEILQHVVSCVPSPAHLAAAGAPAVLHALHAAVLEDLEDVNGWPEVSPELSVGTLCSTLTPAFMQLQQEQRERWEAAAQRAQQLELLKAEVAAAQQALADCDSPETATAAAHKQLAAQQAGLRAELQYLERATRTAEVQAASAEAQVASVRSSAAAVAALEEQEKQVDAAVASLCAADCASLRAWRQGTWHAQERLAAGVAAQRQPLVQLAQQLLDAQRRELAAFRTATQPSSCDTATTALPYQQRNTQSISSSSGSSLHAAAQLLDPLAHLKTEEHLYELLAAAREELRLLQPVAQQWEALAASSTGQLAALQQAAEELGGRVAALQRDCEGGAALTRLREAAVAAEEADALVGRTRQALAEWWASPAVAATPWVKREGKSAEEWLRLLGDQQRALRQRGAFTGKDHSNRLLR